MPLRSMELWFTNGINQCINVGSCLFEYIRWGAIAEHNKGKLQTALNEEQSIRGQ